MRFRKDAYAFAFVLCAGAFFSASPAAPPGEWMYTDEYGTPGYSGVEIVDTSSIGPPYTMGIGLQNTPEMRDDGYDTTESVMAYFTFDYQFTQGWSGFKLMWEDRDINPPWDATGYDSLVIKYIGPLQTHKVDIFFGEAPDRYAPAFLDSIGTLTSNYHATYSNTAWKTVALPIPPAPAGADRTNIREVRFIIHNVTGSALTSAQGNFSFDKVGMIWKSNTGIRAVSNSKSVTNNRLFFTPAMTGTVALSVFSLNGKQLSNRQIPVMAGKQYSIKRLASANTGLSTSQVNIVRISGAGVNVREKIR
jgi:hypothetical protein